MTRDELMEGYVELLQRFKWNFFGTLLFSIPDISPRRANRVFHQWISEMKNEDGTKKFRWFRVTERGAFGDHFHFHILVGGLKEGSRLPWLVRWEQLAGHAVLTYHRRSGGATRYILKTLRPGHDFEIDFDLSRADSKKKSSGANKKEK